MHKKAWKNDPHEINKYILQYKLLLITQQNTNISYNWPAFLVVTTGITSLYALIRISY